jgi:hypothetical protein
VRDFDPAYVSSGSKIVIAVMSAVRPLFHQEQTLVGTHRRSVSCQHRTRAPQQMRSLFGHTLKWDHQYKLSPIDIAAMTDGSPQLF